MQRSIRILKIGAPVLLAATMVLPAHTPAHAAASTLLRYHWVVGQHFSESQHEPSTTTFAFTPKTSIDGTSKELDLYTVTRTVTKVFPDGSGLVHSTYSGVSITTDGKKTNYPLKGYAIDQRIGTTGAVLSTKIIGSQKGLSNLPSDITDPTPTTYPKGPVTIGSVFTQTELIAGIGKVSLHFKVLALGTLQGRATATLAASINQPITFSTNGLTFKGTYTGGGTATVFVDSAAVVSPAHLLLNFHATITGTLNGVKEHGTFTVTGSQNSTPS